MSGFFLFGGILVLLLTTIILAAFRASEDTGAALGPAERRDAAIEAIRELEFEYQTGKLTEEEYHVIRTRLESEALAARDEADGRAPPKRDGPACSECETPLGRSGAFCPACGAAISGR